MKAPRPGRRGPDQAADWSPASPGRQGRRARCRPTSAGW
jgi:hypothetical protein